MRVPTIEGTIRRRFLVNFRVDPEVMQRQLPAPFRPKLQEGMAVAGICLIRLEHLRPKLLPELVGLSSENAAHRVAVVWEDAEGVTREGVYIPRRDTNSPVNLLLGGRLFPGEHHRARFKVDESGDEIKFAMRSEDGAVEVKLAGRVADALPQTSVFRSLAEASSFFEAGSLGYSPTSGGNHLDGLTLQTKEWHVEPLDVKAVFSSYFADEKEFPKGSVEFDHALIMRDLDSEWRNAAELKVKS